MARNQPVPPDINQSRRKPNLNHHRDRSRSRPRMNYIPKNANPSLAELEKLDNGAVLERGSSSKDGNVPDSGNRSYVNIVRKHSLELSKIDADSLSHPPVRTSTGEFVIKIPKDVMARSLEVWKFSLVGRFNFRTLGAKFDEVIQTLCDQWKLSGGVQFIPWFHGYFIIKLFNEDDRKRVSNDGPWKVKSQQLKVLPWTPMFNPESEKITRAAVWVRFPNLHIEYWDEEVLFRIARGLGKPVAVDPRTLRHEYGYFAAVLIDIDFSKPLENIIIDDEKLPARFYVDYYIHNMPDFCDHCKTIGHVEGNCRNKMYSELKKKYEFETDPMKKSALKTELDGLKNVWEKREYTGELPKEHDNAVDDSQTKPAEKPIGGVEFKGKRTLIPSVSNSEEDQIDMEEDVEVSDGEEQVDSETDAAIVRPGSVNVADAVGFGAVELENEERELSAIFAEKKRITDELAKEADLAKIKQDFTLIKLKHMRKLILERGVQTEMPRVDNPDEVAAVASLSIQNNSVGDGFSSQLEFQEGTRQLELLRQ